MAMPGQYPQFPPNPQYRHYPQYAGVSAASRIPPSVQRAVLMMRIGAGVKAVEFVLLLALNSTGLSTKQTAWAGGLLGIGLWLWMAASNQDGNSWARTTGTVFFGLATLGLFVDFWALTTVQQNFDLYQVPIPNAVYALIGCDLLTWLIGLITVILIWQKVSSAFYHPPMAYGGGWGVPGAPAGYPVPYQQGPYPQGAYPQGAYQQSTYPQGAYQQDPYQGTPGYPQGAASQNPYQQGPYPQPDPYQGPTQLSPFQSAPGQDVAPNEPDDPWATPSS